MRDDPGTADQLVLITQLREQIAHLEKQLSGKDAQLLAKEKQVSILIDLTPSHHRHCFSHTGILCVGDATS